MGKSVKVGGNMLKNLKFDTKDPSMWLNGVIILLIVVVFVLLAVQVFTPRKDVIDGFHTIPISNRNLPWPFSDAKFDPIYYSLVFAGKTKNGSADGEGRILFSESFMPLNKDNLPLSVKGTRGGKPMSLNAEVIKAIYDAAAGTKTVDDIQAAIDDEANANLIANASFAKGALPTNQKRGTGIYTNGITDENVLYHSNTRPTDAKKQLPVKKVNGRDIVKVNTDVIKLLKLVEVTNEAGKKQGVVLFQGADGKQGAKRGVKGIVGTKNDDVGGEYISRNTFKKLLELVKKLKITNDTIVALEGRAYGVPAGGTAATDPQKESDDNDLKKYKKIVSDLNAGANYQNFTASERDANDKKLFTLFTGEWKEGKLTKASIRDCGGGDFTIYYNDKEQIDDEDSVEVALQWLRTPMYASCIGA